MQYPGQFVDINWNVTVLFAGAPVRLTVMSHVLSFVGIHVRSGAKLSVGAAAAVTEQAIHSRMESAYVFI